MLSNRARFLNSIAGELTSQANRVRDLIGGSHWLSDGHHKEYLLLDVLARHLPNGVIASRGFVIHPSRSDVVSKEQDILIVDTNLEAPLFSQGGLIVSTPRSVLAALSVKTTLDASTLKDSVENTVSLRNALALSSLEIPQVWCASYFFNLGNQVVRERVKVFDWVEHAVGDLQEYAHVPTWPGPDLIASTSEIAVLVDPPESAASITHQMRGFEVDGTVVLLAHLLSHIALRRTGDRATFGDVAEIEQGRAFQPDASRNIIWPRHSG